jgi:hypothetical protein
MFKLVILSNFAKMTTFPRHIGSRTQLRHVEETIEASNYILEKKWGKPSAMNKSQIYLLFDVAFQTSMAAFHRV